MCVLKNWGSYFVRADKSLPWTMLPYSVIDHHMKVIKRYGILQNGRLYLFSLFVFQYNFNNSNCCLVQMNEVQKLVCEGYLNRERGICKTCLQMYCRLGQENDYDSSRRKSQSVKARGVLRLFSFRCFFLSRFPRRFPSIYFDRS